MITGSRVNDHTHGTTRAGNTADLNTDRTFTGQKQDGTGLLYYNARYYDPALGTFISPDTLVPDPGLVFDYNRYMYVRGNPLKYTDPSGHRLYYAAGAGHDPTNTGYPQMMTSVFAEVGIHDPIDIHAHGNQWSDLLFTLGDNARYPAQEHTVYTDYGVWRISANWRITQAVSEISSNLEANPLAQGEQLNLIGYSTGSVIMAQSALQMANNGYVIDNLILLGSPIQENSNLFQALLGNNNIKNIIRVDIPGDDVNTINHNPLNLFSAAIGLSREDHPHYQYAFGENAPHLSRELATQLMQQGVR